MAFGPGRTQRADSRAARFMQPAWAIVPVVLFGAGAALFAWAGSFSRFWADDYCYSADVLTYGLPRAFTIWYQFSGNRLSTLVAVALSDLFGVAGLRALPAAVLVSLGASLFFFLSSLAAWTGKKVAPLWNLAVSAAAVFFVALLAPDRLQALYWRMGILHYTAPLALVLLHLALLLRWLRRSGPVDLGSIAAAGFGSAALAFFSAGFSETVAALQACVFGGCIVMALLLARPRAWRWRLFLPGLVGTLLMMVVMMRSPSNAWRQAALPPPENLLLVIPYALRYSLDFLFYTLRGQMTPFAVFTLLVAALSIASGLVWQIHATSRRLLWNLLVVAAATYLLIAGSFAPSAYAGLAYPAGRALMPGLLVLLGGLGVGAVLAAVLAARALRGGWLRPAALVLMLLVSLYPLRVLEIPRADARRMAAWAERWDERDALIRQQAGAGTGDVQAVEVEVVQSLEDLRPDPSHWVNICAAAYYRVSSISAMPPGGE